MNSPAPPRSPAGWVPRLAALTALVAVVLPVAPEALAWPATEGRWSEPFDLDVVGIHAAVLPSGRVLLFSQPDDTPGTRARLWNPETERTTPVDLPGTESLFCAGHSILPDGRLFVAGGEAGGFQPGAGLETTKLFDHRRERWRDRPSLRYPRYYPTTVELANGNVLILSGQDESLRTVKLPEVYERRRNRFTTLPTGAALTLPLYPRVHLLPDGRVVTAGPSAATYALSLRENRWDFLDQMNAGGREGGTSVLLPIGPGVESPRILAIGGTTVPLVPNATAEILDFGSPETQWELTAPMETARTNHDSVLLADGTVLVVGGTPVGQYAVAPMAAELFDPETETWTTLAAQRAPRGYHSTAVLLPDGRVLSAGQEQGTSKYTGEVFSPPYLFNGPRPSITSISRSALGYRQQFTIRTKQAPDIGAAALVKPGSVTHGANFDQRYVRLAFERRSEGLVATAPRNGRLAPPGWYMLFVLNSDGTPSVASWVHLS